MKLIEQQIAISILVNQQIIMDSLANRSQTQVERGRLKNAQADTNKIIENVRNDESN